MTNSTHYTHCAYHQCRNHDSKNPLNLNLNYQNLRPCIPRVLRIPRLSYFCSCMLSQKSLTVKPSTIRHIRICIKRFFDFTIDTNIDAYKVAEIKSIITSMQRVNLNPSTIRALLVYPSLAFDEAIKQGFIKENPIALANKPKAQNHSKIPPNLDEVISILKNSSGALKLFLHIAFFTGARSGEILALTLQDINFSNNTIFISKNLTRYGINTPKNGKSRQVYMPNLLKKFLKLHIKNHKIQKDGYIIGKNYFQIYYLFKSLLSRLDLPLYSLHDTRHFYASMLINSDTRQSLIQEMLGHSNLSVLHNVYAHFLRNKDDFNVINKAVNLYFKHY